MQKTPLRRSRPKPWFRPPAERTDPAERQYVMDRDQRCIAAQIDPEHRCDGPETVDHVPDPNVKGMGMRRDIAAPSDRFHLVRLCNSANGDGWASANRDAERRWIASMEGPA